MTREEIIRNLEYTMEKHKNDTINTFGTNISVMCKDILDYLEQETKPKWIPVNERLPETDEDVLITDGVTMYIGWIDATDRQWRADSKDYYFIKDVIAWMPLPEPYKTESEE